MTIQSQKEISALSVNKLYSSNILFCEGTNGLVIIEGVCLIEYP